MNPGTRVYAHLSHASYDPPSNEDELKIDGLSYAVYDSTSNLLSGYHGTAYIELSSKDIIIAHRGTEPNLASGLQDIFTDVGMVTSGFNAQAGDARRFTQRVFEQVQMETSIAGRNITVTGHSLGGTLAQITAHEFGLSGETFNAYGAANLQHDIPKGGDQVINHVRATDVVAAASHHFGSVKIYATAEDIDGLMSSGYKSGVTAMTPRNPLVAAKLGAHAIANFAPDNGLALSDLAPENEARARAHAGPIGLWRDDVHALRANTLSRAWEMAHKAGTARDLMMSAGRSAMHGDFQQAGETLAFAGERAADNIRQHRETTLHTAGLGLDAAAQALRHVARSDGHGQQERGGAVAKPVEFVAAAMAKALPASLRARQAAPALRERLPILLDHPEHPGHTMFQQCLAGVEQLNAKHGVAASPRDGNFAGALAVAAVAKGLDRVEHVFLSDDSSRAFVAQGQVKGGTDGVNRFLAQIPTMDALKTPLADSSMQWLQAFAERGLQEARRVEPEVTPPVLRHSGPVMRR